MSDFGNISKSSWTGPLGNGELTKREVLQCFMSRLNRGEDPGEILFDLLLELDEWLAGA